MVLLIIGLQALAFWIYACLDLQGQYIVSMFANKIDFSGAGALPVIWLHVLDGLELGGNEIFHQSALEFAENPVCLNHGWRVNFGHGAEQADIQGVYFEDISLPIS